MTNNKVFKLAYVLKVSSSKYRELMNMLEREIERKTPSGCLFKRAYQSLGNMQVLQYEESWDNLEKLRDHLSSANFRTLVGGFQLLSDFTQVEIFEAKEITELKELL